LLLTLAALSIGYSKTSDDTCKRIKKEVFISDKFISETEPVIIEYEQRLKDGKKKIAEHKVFCKAHPKNLQECPPEAQKELQWAWDLMNERHMKMINEVKKANIAKEKWKKKGDRCP